MQINNFFYPVYSLIKNKIITILKNTDKKILIAASIAFSFLTTCFVVKSFLSRRVAKIDPKIDAKIELTANLVFEGECQEFVGVEGQKQLQPDGIGKLVCQETIIYVGRFKEGKPHGEGTIFFPEKNLGIFNDKLKHLEEIIDSNLENYEKFEGRFEEGMFKRSNDEVKLTLRNGKTFQGKLEIKEEDNSSYDFDEIADDSGTVTYTDGISSRFLNDDEDKYEIILIYPNKDYYQGEYEEIKGEYEEIRDLQKQGKCIYVPAGKGKMTYGNDDNVYEGEFSGGVPHGKGKMIYVNGELKYIGKKDVYEGEFVNGVPHGKGKKIYANGDVYEGEFVLGLPGKGKMTYTND